MTTPRTRLRRLVVTVTVAVAAIGVFGAGVTFGRWHDSEPLPASTLRSATVTLTADGSAAATLAPLAITPVLGTTATVHRAVTVRNGGNVALTYGLQTTTATSTPADLVTVGLAWRIAVVANVAACTGTNPGTAVTLTTGTAIVGATFSASRPLAVGASEVLCLSFTVPQPLAATFRQGAATPTLTFLGRSP